MPLPDEIFERVLPPRPVPPGLPLVVLLTGFTDAGSVVSTVIDEFRSSARLDTLGIFDNDVLLDYRARRPIMTFEQDHLAEYRPLRLELSLAHDAIGQPFLLVAGYEPDFAWETFVEVVMDAVADYEASTVTWLHSIGMPVPHTRPFPLTISGTRRDVIDALSDWKPRTQFPATAAHLLEYRLAERSNPVAGIVMMLPHYLAETEHPGAAAAALDKLASATGLVFATDRFITEEREFRSRVDEQVQANDELRTMIEGLERRYDSYRADEEPIGSSLLGGVPLPSADELAAELERFLASGPHPDEPETPSDTP